MGTVRLLTAVGGAVIRDELEATLKRLTAEAMDATDPILRMSGMSAWE